MSFLSDLVMKILRWFYELSQKDTLCEDAKKDDKLKQDLRARIDAHERELLIESDLRAKRAAAEVSGAGQSPRVDFRLKRPSGDVQK
jgi:hypothetical protein